MADGHSGSASFRQYSRTLVISPVALFVTSSPGMRTARGRSCRRHAHPHHDLSSQRRGPESMARRRAGPYRRSSCRPPARITSLGMEKTAAGREPGLSAGCLKTKKGIDEWDIAAQHCTR